MAEINVAMLVSQTVTEAQAQSRLKMGRDYASFYEAWAVLRQRIEETKRDAKALEKLHGELWDAIKDGNEDRLLSRWVPSTPTQRRSARPSRAWRRRRSVPWRRAADMTMKSPAPEGAGRRYRRTLI